MTRDSGILLSSLGRVKARLSWGAGIWRVRWAAL